MFTNVNLAAPIGALALLGTALLLFIIAILLVQSLIVRKTRRATIALALMLIVAVLYLGGMLVFSAVSHDKLLARGEEKHFCELDCHLAYSIVDTRQTKTIGAEANALTAHGQFTVITIKTRFDETTIGPMRGNGFLYPNSRALTLIDQNGRRYQPATQSGTALMTPLRPGESYTTEIAFDLPTEAKPTKLLLNEDAWETHLIIGHENSLLHGKTSFQL
ncbi:MAG TPA: hypothetical protein VE863_18395 [Pyrinomonadaceae bacterium]|jgi:hypothetical protein|nr:hypothetical protein [Pyrinomonadaceae bacterium]